MEENSEDIVNLFRFMRLFRINRFKIILRNEEIIRAQVGWPDDGSINNDEVTEVQDIEWKIVRENSMGRALDLGEFILDNNLIAIDKVIIGQKELQDKIGWNADEFSSALDMLLSIKVYMLDGEEKTDSFFLHL